MAIRINYWSLHRFLEEIGGNTLKGAAVGATVGISVTAYLQSKLELAGPLPHTYSTHIAYMQTGVANYAVIPICVCVGMLGGMGYGTLRFCFKKQPEQPLPR